MHFFNSLKDKITLLAKSIENDPENLITIFKVTNSLILGGKNLLSNSKPNQETIDDILKNPHKFELVLRNYMSDETIKHFGNQIEIKKYLNLLKRKNIILGYKIVYDFCRGIDKQYVPLGQATLQVPNMIKSDNKKIKSDFLKYISELLVVTPTFFKDYADQKVTHIAINQYKVPNDRHSWRTQFYGYDLQGAVNLFSYPIFPMLPSRMKVR